MEYRRLSVISWETITKPKGKGGLGIKNASLMNAAFMANLRWELETHSNYRPSS